MSMSVIYVLSATVYLRTSPEVCLERVRRRARKEETALSLVSEMHVNLQVINNVWQQPTKS